MDGTSQPQVKLSPLASTLLVSNRRALPCPALLDGTSHDTKCHSCPSPITSHPIPHSPFPIPPSSRCDVPQARMHMWLMRTGVPVQSTKLRLGVEIPFVHTQTSQHLDDINGLVASSTFLRLCHVLTSTFAITITITITTTITPNTQEAKYSNHSKCH